MNDTPDNTYIEQMATTKLKECLLRTNKVVPKINDMDKEPLWDGHLYLYNSENDIKNKNVKGRIPIQVKGTCQGGLKRSKISYSVSIDDLKKYKRDGGIIYFVIVMGKKLKKFSIYYNSLLPFDIAGILQSKGTQKETTIYLNKFPKQDTAEIIAILNNFIKHREKQMSNAEQGLKMRAMLYEGYNLKDLNIKHFNFDVSRDIFGNIEKTLPTYIYAELQNGTQIPVEAVKFEAISTMVTEQITIGNDKYNCHIEFKNSINGETFVIENSISIFRARGETTSVKINFNLSDDLDERIITLKIIKSIYKYKTLLIPKAFSGKCDNLDNIDINDISERLEYHNKLKQSLDILQVRRKFNMKDLTPKEQYFISFMILSLVDKEPINQKINFSCPVGAITIGNLRILARIDEIESGQQYIKPIQSSDLDGYIIYKNDDSKKYPLTLCSMFKKDDFLTIDNLIYDYLLDSVKRCGYYTETAEKINSMVLEIIAAYDICGENELLDTSIKILEWLISNDKQDIYVINYYQCIKRMRDFSETELDELVRIKKDAENYLILFGINVLLESKTEADYVWNKLNGDEQELIRQYPIYTLYNTLTQ